MVKALHEAGIEVILDVVYNHTAEGNHLGPTLSFRGIDNAAYYRLVDDDPRYYMDTTGTGNSLLVRHPHVLQMIMDSLRYWVLEMHVDGFRFDLAAALAREFHEVDRLSRVLRPGPAGPGGLPGQADRRTVGRGRRRLPGRQLPAAVDRVERQVPGHGPRLLARPARHAARVRLPAHRLQRPVPAATAGVRSPRSTSSPRTTASPWPTWSPTTTSTTRPTARTTGTAATTTGPGTAAPRAPPTTRPSIALRARQKRNFLATLLLSQGVPMLLGGRRDGTHPAGQQQRLLPGQRDLLGGLGRSAPKTDTDLLTSSARSSGLRADHPVFRRRRFFRGQPGRGAGRGWATSPGSPRPGEEMTDDDWAAGFAGRWPCSSTARRSPSRTRAASGPGTTRSCCCSTPASWTWTSPIPPQPLRAALGEGAGHGAAARSLANATAAKPGDAVARPESLPAGPLPWLSRPPGVRPEPSAAGVHLPAAAPAGFRLRRRSRDLADYLADLGVTHVYLSPILQAAPGLRARLRRGGPLARVGRPGRGGRFPARWPAVPRRRLGLIVDIVPNHMAVPVPESLNRPLWSVLRQGRASPLRALVRHRLGGRGRQAAAADPGRRRPRRASTTSRWTDDGPPAEPVLATSTTCCRSGTAPRACRCAAARRASTTGWPTGTAARRRAELAPVLRHRHADRDPGRGPRRSSRPPTQVLPPAGRRRPDRRACGWTTPTACADPAGYLRRLRAPPRRPGVVVEKILACGEELPRLAVRRHHRLRHAAAVGGLFLDRRASGRFTAAYVRLTGGPRPLRRRWPRTPSGGSRPGTLAAELSRLARRSPGRTPGPDGSAAPTGPRCWSSCSPRSACTGRTWCRGEPPPAARPSWPAPPPRPAARLPDGCTAALDAVGDLVLGRGRPRRSRPPADRARSSRPAGR